MKQISTYLIALLALMALGTSVASAATNYGIYIGETMITSDNYSDVLKNGQFSYNPQTKTLTVNNARLTNDGSLGSGISNREVDGLIIRLVGSSTFNTRMNVIGSAKSLSITGTGSLTGNAGETCALYLWGDGITCTINGPVIDLTSKADGLRGIKNATLRVEGSTTSLTLQGSGYHTTVSGLSKLSRGNGIYISEPFMGHFDEERHTICAYQSSEPYTGKVTIGAAYPLFLAKTQVTARNANNITGDGISGTVAYNADLKMLVLNNATITAPEVSNGIQNEGVDGLIITVVGSNSINCTGSGLATILAQKQTSLAGSGMLFLNFTAPKRDYCIRNLSGASFTIDGPVIVGSSQIEAYDGDGKGDLFLKSSSTQLLLSSGSGRAVIKNLPKLVLSSELYITEPYGGYFSSSLQSITTDGTTAYEGTVNISKRKPVLEYGMYIGETAVTENNAADILGDGQFSYNPQTKTLTVRNATLDNDGALGSGIDNREVDGLIVNLVGNNSVTARNFAFITEKRATITGSGSLKLTAREGFGIHLSDGCDLLTIDGPTIEATGNDAGLFDDKRGATLSVKGTNTSLTLKEPENATFSTIFGLHNLELGAGLYLSEPKGGYFSQEIGTVTMDGISGYRGTIVISSKKPITEYALMVGNTRVTSENAADILGDGTVSYDAASKTLLLNNAKLNLDKGIDNQGIYGLNIRVRNYNTIDTRLSAISSACSFSIEGGGVLIATSSTDNGIHLYSDTIKCTVYGTTLEVEGYKYALYDERHSSTVTLKSAEVALRSTQTDTYTAIGNLGMLNLESPMKVKEPKGGYFSPGWGTIVTAHELPEEEITPTTGSIVENPYYGRVQFVNYVEYKLWIAGTQVTADNADDVLGGGSVSFNSNILYLHNAMIPGSIVSELPSLNITVFDNCEINATGYGILAKGRALYFTGNQRGVNSLVINAAGGPGIVLGDSIGCTFRKGAKVTVNADTNAIEGTTGEETIKMTESNYDTSLRLNPATGYALSNIAWLNLKNDYEEFYITEPYGAFFSDGMKTITLDGGTSYKGSVYISKNLPRQPDVNGDGKTDVADIGSIIDIMAGKMIVIPVEGKPLRGDVNRDGAVNVADISTVIDVMAGK